MAKGKGKGKGGKSKGSPALARDKAAEASPSTARAKDKAAEASPSTARAEDKAARAEDNGAEALPLTRGGEIGKAQDIEEDTEEDIEEEYKNWNCFPGLAVQLGHNGMISVLFETPSGFAIFNYDGVKLLLPNADKHIWTDFVYEDRAKEVVWLTKFQPFEDKASAITDTGVDERLSTMIKQCLKPDQKLAVGSERYKNIIDKTMGICCLHDDAVMELMWGLKYCMHHLVPGETKVDRLLMCKGMRTVLNKYHFDYKPEMVTDDLIELLCVVYNSDYCVDMHFETLHEAGKQLMDVSKINCEDWDLLKLVTALKWVCYPKEKLFPDPEMIFSEEERITLERDAPKYKDKLWGNAILVTHNQIVRARLIRNKWLRQLPDYLKEAEDACKAEQEDACKAEQEDA